MTVEEKVSLLRDIFRQVSNLDVLTWGRVPGGYRWTCSSHRAAVRLAEFLISNVRLLHLDPTGFPYYFDPEFGPTVVFEPAADETS